MRKRTIFTEKQSQTLKKNPNTARLTESRISLTLKAKQEILRLHQEGNTPREIVVKLGYDPLMIGEFRTVNMVRNVLRDVNSEAGLHEGYVRATTSRLDDMMVQRLDCAPSSYAKLKNEVIYLRKEVEFLKNLAASDFGKARQIAVGVQSAVYEIIRETLQNADSALSVKELCEIAGVSRSGYYNRINSEATRAVSTLFSMLLVQRRK